MVTAIAAVRGVLAPHRYPQAQIAQAFAAVVSPDGSHQATVERIHAATGVEFRSLALPLEEYATLPGFGAANDVFVAVGLDLAREAIVAALDAAGVAPGAVDLIVSTTVTGLAVPSLEARLALELGFRPDIRRLPIFGLGCAAGAGGIARVHDFLRGDPDGCAVLLAVELCSLTVQRDDLSMANVVASGLFGDGAAAVVMVGDRRAARMGLRGPAVVDSTSRIYPDTQRTMGWDIGEQGFRIVLSAGVPEVVRTYLGDDVTDFLDRHDLKPRDITRWVSHPGGPKVLEAMAEALDLHDGELDVTWRSLAAIGNLSSASVLHVLEDTLGGRDGTGAPPEGSPGLVMAMGPGFASELVLLRW